MSFLCKPGVTEREVVFLWHSAYIGIALIGSLTERNIFVLWHFLFIVTPSRKGQNNVVRHMQLK